MKYQNIYKIFAICLLATQVSASALPPVSTMPAKDEETWKKYCGTATRLSTQIPTPNYANAEVVSAAKKLAKVSPFSFYFYSGPLYAYGLKSGKELNDVPASFPSIPEEVNGKKNAHAFLTLLCGEFRDRPSLIEAKLKWVNKMYLMPDEPQKPIQVNEELWKNVSARSYNLYLENSRAIFASKEQFLKTNNQHAIMGKYKEDYPVEPFTVCETKFIFKNFVEKNAVFGRSNKFSSGDIGGDGEAAEVAMHRKASKRTVAAATAPATMTAEQLQAVYEKAYATFQTCMQDKTQVQKCTADYAATMQPYYDMENAMIAGHNDSGDGDTENLDNPKKLVQRFAVYKEPLFKIYQAQYKKFKAQCSEDDKTHFYDFRGDSNFKPNSPESNGMIWFSSSIANSCTRVNGKMVLKEKVKDKFKDPDICEKYFSSPFAYRWSAARAGLSTWLMHDQKSDATYSNSSLNVTVIPNDTPMNGPFAYQFREREEKLQPYYSPNMKNEKGEYVKWGPDGYVVLTGDELQKAQDQEKAAEADYAAYKKSFEDKQASKPPVVDITDLLPNWMSNRDKYWAQPDIGYNSLVHFDGDKKAGNKELAFERIRDAVNRHTDWYASAYDDGLGTYRDQAYSPFVASSYEMSASNGFTQPGSTVSSPADGCKHWMFVFKLKLDQWYNTRSIMEQRPVNFNVNWFDETSLGTNGLANSERALDRLGTALEGEMDSILYLHNLNTSGEVQKDCGRQAIEANYLNKPVVQ
jgi:hypothetical protein